MSKMKYAVGAVAVAGALGATLLSTGAGADVLPAPPGKAVATKNADVTARCSLAVQSVDPQTFVTYARLSAQAQPSSLFGYATNVYTQVTCSLYSGSTGALVARYSPFVDSATMSARGQNAQLPYAPSYRLCAQAVVKKNNGVTSTTPLNCV